MINIYLTRRYVAVQQRIKAAITLAQSRGKKEKRGQQDQNYAGISISYHNQESWSK